MSKVQLKLHCVYVILHIRHVFRPAGKRKRERNEILLMCRTQLGQKSLENCNFLWPLILLFFFFFGLANIELVLNCLSSAGAWKANTVDGKLTFCSAGFGMFDLLIVVHRKLIDWIKWLQEQSPYLQLIRLISYFTFLSKFKQLLSC